MWVFILDDLRNVKTDRGTFQIVAYNSHNGYYGHEAVVMSRDLTLSLTL